MRWFDQTSMDDVTVVGGKNVSLYETYRELTPRGIRVPNGFATTAEANRTVLHESALDEKTPEVLPGLNNSDVGNLHHHAVIIAT